MRDVREREMLLFFLPFDEYTHDRMLLFYATFVLHTVSFAEDKEMRKKGTELLDILASSLRYIAYGERERGRENYRDLLVAL